MDCIEWTGYCNKAGYGMKTGSRNGKFTLTAVHRLEWMKHYGEIPKGMQVCHTCDNPRCYNIKHLWMGTAKQNRDDMVAKGREKHAKGEQHGLSRLTEEEVREIRRLISDGLNAVQIAKKYDVGRSTILNIKFKKCWAWLT